MLRYTVYGELNNWNTLALTSTLAAKGLEVDLVAQTASLTLALATRTGCNSGPYLRTPDGIVLADLHVMLDWVERVHPKPPLLPTTPVRRISARLLEDWLELWLPSWPRRSWSTLEGLGRHLGAAGFLLGREACRADWMLAAWLEAEVLNHEHARIVLARTAPSLVSLGDDLLEASHGETLDDVVPISLLPVLAEIAGDYHAYLVGSHRALKDRSDRVLLDLGLGRRALPVRRPCEARRVELGHELARFEPAARRDVRRILEPVGAWHALTLPSVLEEIDPSDPRSL